MGSFSGITSLSLEKTNFPSTGSHQFPTPPPQEVGFFEHLQEGEFLERVQLHGYPPPGFLQGLYVGFFPNICWLWWACVVHGGQSATENTMKDSLAYRGRSQTYKQAPGLGGA